MIIGQGNDAVDRTTYRRRILGLGSAALKGARTQAHEPLGSNDQVSRTVA